jgi:hypothetical protein
VAEQPALWRRAFDAAERAVAPTLESLVRTEEYARVAATVTWAQAAVRHRLVDTSAAVWHLVNLPAGSDLTRLRAQVGALDREVRRLSLHLEEEQSRHRPHDEEATDDRRRTATAGGRPRPDPPRRRAQHPQGP